MAWREATNPSGIDDIMAIVAASGVAIYQDSTTAEGLGNIRRRPFGALFIYDDPGFNVVLALNGTNENPPAQRGHVAMCVMSGNWIPADCNKIALRKAIEYFHSVGLRNWEAPTYDNYNHQKMDEFITLTEGNINAGGEFAGRSVSRDRKGNDKFVLRFGDSK